MKHNLEEIRRILIDLQSRIAYRGSLMSQTQGPIWKDSGITMSYWEREEAYCFMYATDNYLPLLQTRKEKLKIPEVYNEPASSYYQGWYKKKSRILQNKGCNFIPEPIEKESLYQYLHRLAEEINGKSEEDAENGKKTTIMYERRQFWITSLKMFLQYLREQLEFEEKGYLDIIFPEHMNIDYANAIIRLVPETLYPIDILATCQILQNLVYLTLEGETKARKTAAEALGLSWVCLVAARSRRLTELQILRKINLTNLMFKEKNEDNCLDSAQLLTPTRFGTEALPISTILYNFLQALPQVRSDNSLNTSLFTSAPKNLRAILEQAIQMSARAKKLGKISFLTLMSLPHEAIGYRSPKNV